MSHAHQQQHSVLLSPVPDSSLFCVPRSACPSDSASVVVVVVVAVLPLVLLLLSTSAVNPISDKIVSSMWQMRLRQ